ncbi:MULTISPECIES: hypothetical protein [unclassified Streptomyces]|uniref:hypothetical protein n=1 Tax=unclassified Streptomyces TaxID=2593676 RepID=UPI0023F68CA3|nr:hypothetical protein [Streptomyces sp. JH010]MDF6066139.1 hypothetical protein [Streptomyces sp. JH010]WSS88007.1 hypothetical protein OG199_35685 [Streptomyces sp. NBC_01176]
MAEAQIILSHSRDSGIVAIASGEQYPWAHTALAESGFRRDDDGVYHLPADGNQTTVVDLVKCAKRHRTSVHTSSRRFIGDAARDLARQLPGQWTTSVEIYSHPAWQEDLVPWIWDSGVLGRALQSERIPYAATLTDTVHGTTLLFVERPGRQLDYLVGAFAPEGLEEGYGDPHGPRSIVLPPFAGRAAQAVADRYLPSYEQAVHARRTSAIAAVLGGIRSEHDTWQAMVASGRYSDATPLSAAALGAATEEFLDHSWRRFLTVVDHAPTLIDRCRPASSPWPDDAATLSRLADAVTNAETLLDEVVHGGPVPSQERNARAWPAIETWLTDGETFLRQARVSAPHRRPALPVSAPARPLTAARPTHLSH